VSELLDVRLRHSVEVRSSREMYETRKRLFDFLEERLRGSVGAMGHIGFDEDGKPLYRLLMRLQGQNVHVPEVFSHVGAEIKKKWLWLIGPSSVAPGDAVCLTAFDSWTNIHHWARQLDESILREIQRGEQVPSWFKGRRIFNVNRRTLFPMYHRNCPVRPADVEACIRAFSAREEGECWISPDIALQGGSPWKCMACRLLSVISSLQEGVLQPSKAKDSRYLVVVGLDKAVTLEHDFREKHPNYKPGKPCAIVAVSALQPEAWFEKYRQQDSHCPVVKKYGEYLMKKKYQKHNPIQADRAEFVKEEVINSLRSKGYAVWVG